MVPVRFHVACVVSEVERECGSTGREDARDHILFTDQSDIHVVVLRQIAQCVTSFPGTGIDDPAVRAFRTDFGHSAFAVVHVATGGPEVDKDVVVRRIEDLSEREGFGVSSLLQIRFYHHQTVREGVVLGRVEVHVLRGERAVMGHVLMVCW